MKVQVIQEGFAATAVANGTAITTATSGFGDTPFVNRQPVVGVIDLAGAVTAAGVAKIQGSDDGTTYVDLLTSAGIAGKKGNIVCYPYMRGIVSTAATGAGSTVSFYLLSN